MCSLAQNRLFSISSERFGNVQLIHYSRGLQQNDHQEWKSNFYLNASTQSQVQLTTPNVMCLIMGAINSDNLPAIFGKTKYFNNMNRLVCSYIKKERKKERVTKLK